MSGKPEVTWIPIGRLGAVRMGKQLSPVATNHPKQSPYLRVANVLEDRIDYSDIKTMHFSATEREIFGLRPGDILLNEGQSIELVGRSAIFDGPRNEFCFQNHLLRYRTGRELDPRFAQLVFLAWLHTGAFARIARQTTSIATLGAQRFAAMPFPWIALSEQCKTIDQIADVSARAKTAHNAVVKLRYARQGLIQQLLHPLTTSHEIPIPVVHLGEVRMGKQLSPVATSHPEQSPYLRVANVLEGRIDYSDIKSMHFSATEREIFGLRPGDILLNEGQSIELVGRNAIFEGLPEKYCFQNTLIRYRVNEKLDSRYAQLVFADWLRRGHFARIARQTTSIAHLGADRFGEMKFPWIPVDQQHRTINQLAVADAAIRAAEDEAAKLLDLKRAITDALLPRPVSKQPGEKQGIIEA